jgi:hypothetical protein
MTKFWATLGIVAVAFSASVAGAQQSPTSPRQPRHAATRAGAGESMMMDSLNRRLDSLVERMNRTNSNQKVEAMAAVITELVAQRKAMQHHMRHMMGAKGDMKSMMDRSVSPAAPKPTPKRAPNAKPATPDTSGHAEHHPPQ